MSIVVAVQRYADLVKVVLALRPCRGLPDFLHSGHQERNQNGDDRDDDQQFDQSERLTHGRLLSPHNSLRDSQRAIPLGFSMVLLRGDTNVSSKGQAQYRKKVAVVGLS